MVSFLKHLNINAYIAVFMESDAPNKQKHWIVSAVISPEKGEKGRSVSKLFGDDR